MGTRVYIGGLPYRVKERDIERFFRGYGKLREVLIKNGYGFVVSVTWIYKKKLRKTNDFTKSYRNSKTTATLMTLSTSWMAKSFVENGKRIFLLFKMEDLGKPSIRDFILQQIWSTRS